LKGKKVPALYDNHAHTNLAIENILVQKSQIERETKVRKERKLGSALVPLYKLHHKKSPHPPTAPEGNKKKHRRNTAPTSHKYKSGGQE
jgi:hypothetical protein